MKRKRIQKQEKQAIILGEIKSRPVTAVNVLIIGSFFLIAAMVLSILFGAAEIAPQTIWDAIIAFDPSQTGHLIIWDLRLPRMLAAALVGACLALSGAMMQGLTQNPLASPSLMGVSAGSAFMIAIAFAFFPGIGHYGLMAFSLAGSGIGAGLILLIGSISKRGSAPVTLALAGSAVSAFLQSISTGIALHFNVARDISFWYAGGVAGVRWDSLFLLSVITFFGFIGALLFSRSLTILSLGEEIATGLGQRTTTVKTIGALLILILTGAAVAIAGTIGFVGLVIPHITRRLVGVDYRWVIPCSALLGALLLVLADIGARMFNPPYETPVGVLTAMIGVPFFLYLARREGMGWG